MSQQAPPRKSILTLIGQIGWPAILGTAISGVFFALVFQGPLNTKAFNRYFAGHPISMVEVAFFFIGLTALFLKAMEIWGENSQLDQVTLGPADEEKLAANQVSMLLDRWAEMTTAQRESHLGRRLRESLESIQRNGTADNVDEELKYLADSAVGQQQDSYSLTRIIVWAIPMLGFLGTVVGITEALGNLDPKQLASAPDIAFEGLKNGLYTAFDTTAVALSFSMVLMFIQFFLDRVESNLLSAVDVKAANEMAGRFEVIGAGSDPNVQTIKRMCAAVISASETLTHRQAELWQGTLSTAQEQWERQATVAGETMTTALSAAIGPVLQKHVEQLTATEQKANEQLQKRWDHWQTALSDNARMLHAHQQELIRQGEVMTQAIRATGDVVQLETALNSNLQALAGSRNFEETVLSLAAAINLLNNRLGKTDATHVDLPKTGKGKAA